MQFSAGFIGSEATEAKKNCDAFSLPPLCVDLDGTLVKTDLLWETVVVLLKNSPWKAPLLPFWLLAGKARLKERLARDVTLDCASLPYALDLLAYLRQARAEGRSLVLVSGCARSLGTQIADHLKLFDDVIFSENDVNVRGATKARLLEERFGLHGFDYVGNECADYPVWEAGRECLVANAPQRVVRRLAQRTTPLHRFAPPVNRLLACFRALRCYQWSKNLLVFLPVLAGHAYFSPPAVTGALLMFLAWCLVASGIYVSNDLLDLDADRHHPTKRLRPFAGGDLPLAVGLFLAPLLLAGGLGLALCLSRACAGTLLLYAAAAFAYSYHLKKRSLVDVFILAFFFAIRVVSGGLASGHSVSLWLLAFTSFLFLALAFLKRCSELLRIQAQGRHHLGSRAYGVADLPVLEMFGVASAFTAIMVLGLYLSSAVAETHYHWPAALWAEAPFLLLWLCRLWLATARGEMHDDPIVYSIKDWVSWVLGGCVLVTFIVATTGKFA